MDNNANKRFFTTTNKKKKKIGRQCEPHRKGLLCQKKNFEKKYGRLEIDIFFVIFDSMYQQSLHRIYVRTASN